MLAARFHFHFNQLKTGEDDRDKAMDGWEAESSRFRTGAFVLTAVKSALSWPGASSPAAACSACTA